MIWHWFLRRFWQDLPFRELCEFPHVFQPSPFGVFAFEREIPGFVFALSDLCYPKSWFQFEVWCCHFLCYHRWTMLLILLQNRHRRIRNDILLSSFLDHISKILWKYVVIFYTIWREKLIWFVVFCYEWKICKSKFRSSRTKIFTCMHAWENKICI